MADPATAPSSTPSVSSTTSSPTPPKYYGTDPIIHNAAIVVTVLGAIGLALPPRRADLRNAMLSAVTFFGSNQLVHDYTGRSLQDRFGARVADAIGAEGGVAGLPESARRAQAAMAAERERREQQQPQQKPKKIERDWVRAWDEAEQKAFAEGRGYGGLIMDALREVTRADYYGREKQPGDDGGPKPADIDRAGDPKAAGQRKEDLGKGKRP